MATIKFSNGVKVNFNGTPTQKDIEEIAAKVAGQPVKPTEPTPAHTPSKPGGIVGAAQSAGDFLGISNFGKGLGVAAAVGGKDVRNAEKSQEGLRAITNQLLQHALELPPASPRRKELLKLVQSNEQMLGDLADEVIKEAPSNREFLSSAANTAINIAGAGTLGAKSAGAGVLGTTKYAAAPLKTLVGTSAAQAGLLSTSKSLGEGKSVKDSVSDAIGPAALAGGLTLGTGLIARAITKKLQAAPKNVITKTVKQGVEDTKKEVLQKATSDVAGEQFDETKDFAETLLRDKVKGGKPNLLKKAITQVDDIGKKIKSLVATPDLGVTDEAGKLLDGPESGLATDAGMKAFGKAARNSESRVAPLIKTEKYREFFEELLQKQGAAIDDADQELLHRAAVGNLNISDGLELRQFLDSITPKGGFAADPSVAVSSRALTKASGDLRGQIRLWGEKFAPELQPLLNKQSVYIRLRDSMVDQIAAEIRKRPNISINGLMNAVSGALFDPALTTRFAQGIRSTNQALDATAGLRNLGRSAIISGSVNAQK